MPQDPDAPQVIRDGTRLRLSSASGLLVEASTTGNDGVLEQFYRDYDKAFVLENEKEGFDGFAACLELNSGARYGELTRRYGPFREFVIVLTDPATGTRIGGANFIVFPLRRGRHDPGHVLSSNLNYVFVNPDCRSRGYLKRIVDDLPDVFRRLFTATNAPDMPSQGAATPVYIFIEQNDPYRMPREDYELDTKYTGLDQIARIGIWARMGARIVDFPYVQPPLTSEQEADHTLVYGVIGAPGDTLDACLLQGQLERFFGISVLKGADIEAEPATAKQLATLAQMCATDTPIRLLVKAQHQALPAPPWQSGATTAVESLRAVLSKNA